ncbi:hypothetical protein [Sphingomonas sp. LT1P40]|uniref:hypothetical protein n=1 Tax=Alteristakelama amylovorans TaxID=3096166 RepID=UPI002FC7C600
MVTVKRLIKEFYLPLLMAVAWTAFIIASDGASLSVASLATTFAPAFFLSSWATGQWIRVVRQTKVESSLEKSLSKMEDLAQTILQASEGIISTLTGKGAFAYIDMQVTTGGDLLPCILHYGKHNIDGLYVTIFNRDTKYLGNLADTYLRNKGVNVGVLVAGTVFYDDKFLIESLGKTELNLLAMFTAKSGHWEQELRLRKIDGVWVQAFILYDSEHNVIGRRLPVLFPVIGDEMFDKWPRDNAVIVEA